MSGVFKAIGKGFKAVAKGIGDVAEGIWHVTKDIWKPALLAASAYFAVGMASGHFGDGELMASMPGFGEEGIFTRFANWTGLGTGESARASPVADLPTSRGGPYGGSAIEQATGINLDPLAQEPKLFLKNPYGDPMGGTTPANPGGGSFLDTLGKIPDGAYYLGGQILGGIGQGLAQSAQLDEQKREYNQSLAQRQKEFNQSRQFAGSFYGMDRSGQGGAPTLNPAVIPQLNTPLSRPQQVPNLTVDDLLRLQAQGVVR